MIEVIDQIKQKNNGDFPLMDTNDLKGGFMLVNTIELRDNIPDSRRKDGMVCYVADENTYYYLKSGLWAELSYTLAKSDSYDIKVRGSLYLAGGYYKLVAYKVTNAPDPEEILLSYNTNVYSILKNARKIVIDWGNLEDAPVMLSKDSNESNIGLIPYSTIYGVSNLNFSIFVYYGHWAIVRKFGGNLTGRDYTIVNPPDSIYIDACGKDLTTELEISFIDLTGEDIKDEDLLTTLLKYRTILETDDAYIILYLTYMSKSEPTIEFVEAGNHSNRYIMRAYEDGKMTIIKQT